MIDGFPDVLAFQQDNVSIEHSEIEPEPVKAHEIAVSWYGFTDTASRNHNSTIKGYSLAIGNY